MNPGNICPLVVFTLKKGILMYLLHLPIFQVKGLVRINDDQHQWGLVLHITGDPKEYGRVYVGTHGRGTVYGDPTVGSK